MSLNVSADKGFKKYHSWGLLLLECKRKKARISLEADNTFELIASKYIDEKMGPTRRATCNCRPSGCRSIARALV